MSTEDKLRAELEEAFLELQQSAQDLRALCKHLPSTEEAEAIRNAGERTKLAIDHHQKILNRLDSRQKTSV